MENNTQLTDSLEFVVRDSTGRVKEARLYLTRCGVTMEFIGNARYRALLDEGKTPTKMPLFYGRWRIVTEKTT